MDKIKIGIPRSMYYYYYGDFWEKLFTKFNFEIILSPKTNKEIMNLGMKYSYDEMCLSLKNYIGHIAYLKDKCDYILIPRIDNFGSNNQTCTNFLATYDLINNLFNVNILNYNIDEEHGQSEKIAIIELLEKFGFKRNKIIKIYNEVKKEVEYQRKIKIMKNLEKLESKKIKILLVGHPYNIYDEYIGKSVIKILNELNIEIIYSDLFDKEEANINSKKLSNTLYFKYSKEIIGSIPRLINKIDGIIFITAFPCSLDSLVNELVIRKIKIPTLNLIIDDLDSLTGFETRLESFIDVIERRKNIETKN